MVSTALEDTLAAAQGCDLSLATNSIIHLRITVLVSLKTRRQSNFLTTFAYGLPLAHLV